MNLKNKGFIFIFQIKNLLKTINLKDDKQNKFKRKVFKKLF